jgi:gliding motility-associated-like protein
VATSEFGLFTVAELTVAPIAVDDQATTEEDTPVAIDVVFNRDNTSGINEDMDANGLNPASIRIVTLPQHGTVSVDPSSGIVTYAPEADYNNDITTPDIFTYVVEDTKGVVSNEATVSITVPPVNDAPRVSDDQDTTSFATVLVGGSVLENDTDPENNQLTASLVSNPSSGTLDFREDGTYTYTPNATFSGEDSFTYQACDDGSPSACATATVRIFVRPFNHAPQAQVDIFSTEEDQVLEGNVMLNDTDANADDVLTVGTTPVQNPEHGTVTWQVNGNFVYTPAANFFGTDSLAYQVCDDGEPPRCDTAWVIITITPINDAPVAIDDAFTASEDEVVTGQVLGNDYDIEGSDLVNVAEISGPTSGSLTLLADGTFTYVPRRGFTGEDSFVYQVCDAQDPALCSQATVRISVEAGLLVIPKGFSPNGDQVGDYWHLKGIAGYPGSLVTIFNRWGNMVFQAMGYDNQNIVWTGESERGLRLGGSQLPEGTYFYVIDLGKGHKPISGYVLLKR